MYKIFIDVGHGGKGPGAVGNGLKEKDINLSVALKVGNIFKRHDVEVIYSRTTDIFVDLTPRANNAKADIFASFHINSATNSNARGFEIWTTVGQTKSNLLADMIGNCLIEDFPNVPFRKDMSDVDLDKEKNFTVTYKSNMPVVLLELGFIVNAQDANMLRTEQDMRVQIPSPAPNVK